MWDVWEWRFNSCVLQLSILCVCVFVLMMFQVSNKQAIKRESQTYYNYSMWHSFIYSSPFVVVSSSRGGVHCPNHLSWKWEREKEINERTSEWEKYRNLGRKLISCCLLLSLLCDLNENKKVVVAIIDDIVRIFHHCFDLIISMKFGDEEKGGKTSIKSIDIAKILFSKSNDVKK